jgi:hypothetical protein
LAPSSLAAKAPVAPIASAAPVATGATSARACDSFVSPAAAIDDVPNDAARAGVVASAAQAAQAASSIDRFRIRVTPGSSTSLSDAPAGQVTARGVSRRQLVRRSRAPLQSCPVNARVKFTWPVAAVTPPSTTMFAPVT